MGEVLVTFYVCTIALVIGAYLVYKADDVGARRFGGALVCLAIIGYFFSYYHITLQEKDIGNIYSNNYSSAQIYYPKVSNGN